jgi:hypothetical protein|tara:strand:- start:8 stop:208 length:201 start_codon:yes stop_codon:yes gene_type:complete
MNPYDEGQKSFKLGKLSNPYSINSNNNRSWEYGFNTAYFSNLKKVSDNEQRIRERSKKVYAKEANT